MNRLRRMIRCIFLLIVAVLLLLSGCGSNSGTSSNQNSVVNLDTAALLVSINNSLLTPLPKSIGGWEWQRFATAFGTILTTSTYNLSLQKVSYQSTGADGTPRTLSG